MGKTFRQLCRLWPGRSRATQKPRAAGNLGGRCASNLPTANSHEKERAEYNRQHLEGWNEIVEKAGTGNYDLVVVDEILGALKEKALDLEDILKVVKDENRVYELVFSGREAPVELVELADYASRIEEVKHPYTKGIKGRKGIEF